MSGAGGKDVLDDSDSDDDVGAGAPVKGASKGFALKLQKKLMGMTVKSKDSAKHFVDDDSGALLDILEAVALRFCADEKVAKKAMKDLIKLSVKLGLLYKHNAFNDAEIADGRKFRSKFKMCALTMISYHDVAFTFDAGFLSDVMGEAKKLLKGQILRHLSEKSQGRVDNVFGFFGGEALMSALYTDPAYKELLEKFNAELNKLVERL